ncbi:MAG: hypothetical protein ACE14S_07685 [Candidatus Bathyarchaeia archaeon]
MPEKSSSSVDIFGLLSGSGEKAEKKEQPKKKTQRQELLEAAGVKEFFAEGKLRVNMHTCVGVQCNLCIKACPTHALYWRAGEIAVTEDLCVYCGACVLSCMVDDCIKVTRKREDGAAEKFSKTRDFVVLTNDINAKRRFQRVREVFPDWEGYCERYWRQK